MNFSYIKNKKQKEKTEKRKKIGKAIVITCVALYLLTCIFMVVREFRLLEGEILANNGHVVHSSKEETVATWYDYDLNSKNQKCLTDNCYSKTHLTCASRDYKKGTMLKVSYKNKSVVCRVNDYGPEEWTGVGIDLSSYTFKKLAPLSVGKINVNVQ